MILWIWKSRNYRGFLCQATDLTSDQLCIGMADVGKLPTLEKLSDRLIGGTKRASPEDAFRDWSLQKNHRNKNQFQSWALAVAITTLGFGGPTCLLLGQRNTKAKLSRCYCSSNMKTRLLKALSRRIFVAITSNKYMRGFAHRPSTNKNVPGRWSQVQFLEDD